MSTCAHPDVESGTEIVPLTAGEPIVRHPEREIGILLAREEITITHARYSAGQRVAGPHIHLEHTDAFYVLEGELTFTVGREAKTITVGAGGFLAAPPHVAHSFANQSGRPARWLTIHAHDGGFAAFMRGVRDGVAVEWDIAAVPADGGPPASAAIVSPDLAAERREPDNQPCRLRCALPDLRVRDWRLPGLHPLGLPLHHQTGQLDTFLLLGGREPGPVHLLSLHTPNRRFGGDHRPETELRRLPVS